MPELQTNMTVLHIYVTGTNIPVTNIQPFRNQYKSMLLVSSTDAAIICTSPSSSSFFIHAAQTPSSVHIQNHLSTDAFEHAPVWSWQKCLRRCQVPTLQKTPSHAPSTFGEQHRMVPTNVRLQHTQEVLSRNVNKTRTQHDPLSQDRFASENDPQPCHSSTWVKCSSEYAFGSICAHRV